MSQSWYDEGTAVPVSQEMSPAPSRCFSTTDTVFAWVCVLGGYLFCRAFPVGAHPFGGLLFLLILFGATAVLGALQGARFGVMPVLAAVSAVAVSGGLLMCANSFLHTLAYIYALVTYLYFVYALHAPDCGKGFSDRVAVDYFKAVVILPFCSFGCVFSALFSGRMKSSGKQVGKVLIGIALAVIPTVAVVSLLSYDDGFREMLNRLFDFDFETIWLHLWSLAFAIPISMYLFGLFVSSKEGKGAEILTPESCQKAAVATRVAPAVTVAVAAAPLLFLYGVFFLSQWDYYMSAFTGVLPEAFSYADYAREGFFQLCTVAVINLAVIVASAVFMKRKDDGRSALLTVLVILFSVCTLVLIATAMAKLTMYIDSYGLTPKRIYAAWVMLVLMLVFVILTIKQFARRLPAVALCGAVTVAMFAGLVLCGTDSLIARYNVEHYLDGRLDEVDMGVMEELGDAAIPSLVYMAEELDERYGTDIADPDMSFMDARSAQQRELMLYLRRVVQLRRTETPTVWETTLPYWRADQALESAGWL